MKKCVYINELFCKMRSKTDIINFFFQKEQKNFLPIACFGGFVLRYYSKSKSLTKESIFQKFNGDNELLAYLLDNTPLTSIT